MLPAFAEAPADYTGATVKCPKCSTVIAAEPLPGYIVRSPRDVFIHAGHLPFAEREELHVLLMDTKNRVHRDVTVYVGNVSSSLVRVGELFREAVRDNATGIILVHNHPSGDATPSPDDLHMTAEALAAGRLIDIDVLDHVIVARDSYVSLRDRGVSFDRITRRPAPPAM